MKWGANSGLWEEWHDLTSIYKFYSLWLRLDWKGTKWKQEGQFGGYYSSKLRDETNSTQRWNRGGIEKWVHISHIFKVDPIGFHGGVDVVYEKKKWGKWQDFCPKQLSEKICYGLKCERLSEKLVWWRGRNTRSSLKVWLLGVWIDVSHRQLKVQSEDTNVTI